MKCQDQSLKWNSPLHPPIWTLLRVYDSQLSSYREDEPLSDRQDQPGDWHDAEQFDREYNRFVVIADSRRWQILVYIFISYWLWGLKDTEWNLFWSIIKREKIEQEHLPTYLRALYPCGNFFTYRLNNFHYKAFSDLHTQCLENELNNNSSIMCNCRGDLMRQIHLFMLIRVRQQKPDTI